MGQDRNDLSYWFPILTSTGVLVPKTTIVNTTGDVYPAAFGEYTPHFAPLIEELKKAAAGYGYPVFLRTGQGSGKHYWDKTCFVEREADIKRHVLELIEWSECADFLGLSTETWCIREFLSLAVGFLAFAGSMPVSKERRWFFKDGQIVCHHPYWPELAIDGHNPQRADWKDVLARLNHESAEEIDELSALTLPVAKAFDGAWSLDWACTSDGRWYAIDMAMAHRSYHNEACPHFAMLRQRPAPPTPSPTPPNVR